MLAKIYKFLFLGLCLSLTACPNKQPNTAVETTTVSKTPVKASDLKSQYQDLMNLLEDKSCSSDSDCGALPIGARACGGPDAYMVYSKKNPQVAQLEQLARDYSKAREKYNRENQGASICAMEMKPKVACVQGQCRKASTKNIIQ